MKRYDKITFQNYNKVQTGPRKFESAFRYDFSSCSCAFFEENDCALVLVCIHTLSHGNLSIMSSNNVFSEMITQICIKQTYGVTNSVILPT